MGAVVIESHAPTSYEADSPDFTLGNKVTPIENETLLGLQIIVGKVALSPGDEFLIRVRVYDANTGSSLRSGAVTDDFIQGETRTIYFSSSVILEAGKSYLITAYSAACTFGINTSVNSVHTHDYPTSTFDHVITWNNEKRTGSGDAFPGFASAGDEISLSPIVNHPNSPPNVPIDLTHVSSSTDTTPSFRCVISDPDSGDQVKARFEVKLGGDVLGTIESSLVASGSTVTLEYPNILSPNLYTVTARAIDSNGASSDETDPLEFNITSQVSMNTELLWDLRGYVQLPTEVLWGVAEENTISFELLWNIVVFYEFNLEFFWNLQTPWETVPFDLPVTLWVEVSKDLSSNIPVEEDDGTVYVLLDGFFVVVDGDYLVL